MSNPAPTLNQINAFNATQGTTISFNIIGGTEVIRSNKIYIYDLSDNSLICTHLYVSTESIHELPANTDSSMVYASGKSSADFTNNTQYYAQIQTFTDTNGTQGASGLSVAKLFWCLPTPTLTIATIPSTISTTSYNVSATYTSNTSGSATNEIQQFQFNLYSGVGALLQTSSVILYGDGVDLSYNFSGLEVNSIYYVTLDVTTTQGMNVSVQSNTFTVSIDTPTMGSASVVNNGCDGYISVTSNLSSEYEHEESVDSGEIMSFTTDSVNDITELDVDFSPVQDGTPWMSAQDTKPYTFRIVPTQTEDFGHELDTLVGGSVVWHQLLTGGKGDSATGWSGIRCTVTSNGEELTATCAGTGFATAPKGFAQSPVGHAYLVSFDAKVSATNITLGGSLSSNSIGTNYFLSNYAFASANTWERIARVIVPTDDSVALFRLGTGNATANQTFSFKNVQIFDLTKMFGTTIADRAYTMEQSQSGSGIAWLKSYGFFTDRYYAYSAPTIQSVEATKHITTGKNLLPMTVSRIKSENTYGTWNGNVYTNSGCTYELLTEDGNNVTGIKVNGTSTANAAVWLGAFNYIAGTSVKINSGVTTGSIDVFFRMSGSGKGVYTYQFNSYGADKTISGTTNMELWGNIRVGNGQTLNNMIFKPSLVFSENTTDFEPYVAHEYTLDSDLVLRGVPKLDASNNLYYDGDTYASDGTVTRKYPQGTISVTSVYTHPNNNVVDFAVFATSSLYAQPLSIFGEKINSVATTYESVTTNGVALIFNASTKLVAISIPKGTSLADAQTLLNGSAYVYELATTTTESADAYTNPQIVDPSGTEEYVGSSIPVGHKTTYQRICPINGWDSVEVDVVGKNLFDDSTPVTYGQYLSAGTYTDSSTRMMTDYVEIKSNIDYTAQVDVDRSAMLMFINYNYFDADKNWLGNRTTNGDTSLVGLRTKTFNISDARAKYIRLVVTSDPDGSTLTGRTFVGADMQIELGSIATTYTPYNGTTYTSTFPKYKQQVAQDATPYITNAIYSGTLDMAKGVLTINMVSVDLGTLNWTYRTTSTVPFFFASIAGMVLKGKLTSDRYVQTTLLPNNANFPNGGISNNSYFVTPTNVMIRDDGFTDSTSFKTAVTGSKLVYELATPIEISLTPQQLQTLSGQNNIWSNTNGGMSLVYQLPITSLLVKRRDVADVSGKWLTLYSTPITQASDMDFTFIDFLNQYGKTYQYALVPVLAQNQSGVVVQIEGGYTVSDNVDSIFDGVYIADQTNVERVKAGVGYGNIDMNQGVGSITPIGSKYPIVITNSQNQYHNGSVRGTIVPNDFYSNGNLSRIDMVNKRDELEQFLTNKHAKIIKDWNGKMWLVMIMSNVACSFDDNYGMGIVSFSADWLEVGDPTNQQDLYNAGLINVGGV